MSKKVLTYVSLAVGCLACIAAIFYLVNTISTSTNANWSAEEMGWKYIIYIMVVLVALALTTIGLCFGGVRIIKSYLDKKEINNSLFVLPMATYFASELVFAGLQLGFWGLDSIRSWIFAVIALGGLFITFCPTLGKLDEKNSKLTYLCASILGFVLSIVALTNAGGVGAAALVFVMFMFGCVAAIYITYVFTEYNNAPKAEVNEEKAIETKESNDSEEKTE